MILDSSTYAFTTLLTTFLVGIALGSYVMSRVIDRLHRPLIAFIILEGAIGGAAFGGLFLFAELPYLFVVLYRNFGDSMNLIFLSKFLLTFLVMFVPTLLIGALFPIVVKLYTTQFARVGRSIGEVYSLNTLGCILGSFGAGFIFVPIMGIQNSILLAIGMNFLLAFLLLWASPYRIPLGKGPLTVVLLAGITILSSYIPQWRPALMSSGIYMYVRFVQDLDRQQLFVNYAKGADPLLFYREGYTSTVSVHQSKNSENIYLKVNGKVEASTVGDMPTQILLSQIPMLFSKREEDVLIIGLGSGVTVGSAATHPARRITVVEVEPAVVEANKYFEQVHHRVLSDPRVRVMAHDARNYLLVTPETFDVIISEPSNPWMAGVSNLFTREFFILGSRRLKEGGLFCQWLQLYKISPDNLRSILRTFNSVFPNILIFESSQYDLFLLGSFEPLKIDIDFLNRHLSQPSVQADLERIGIKSVREVLSHFLFGSQEIPLFSQGAPLTTDDNALLEFSMPKTLYIDTSDANFKEISKFSKGFHSYMRR
jgi:spermidine synthase